MDEKREQYLLRERVAAMRPRERNNCFRLNLVKPPRASAERPDDDAIDCVDGKPCGTCGKTRALPTSNGTLRCVRCGRERYA